KPGVSRCGFTQRRLAPRRAANTAALLVYAPDPCPTNRFPRAWASLERDAEAAADERVVHVPAAEPRQLQPEGDADLVVRHDPDAKAQPQTVLPDEPAGRDGVLHLLDVDRRRLVPETEAGLRVRREGRLADRPGDRRSDDEVVKV